jgi:hypothetical protein
MWMLHWKEILAKDNPTKLNSQGCKVRAFCDKDEYINHLFLAHYIYANQFVSSF